MFYKLRWKLPTELKISHTIADADGMGDYSDVLIPNGKTLKDFIGG